MKGASTVEELRARVEISLRLLRGGSPGDLSGIKADVAPLRDLRQYDLMGKLAEAISRKDPGDHKNRKLYAQYLVETGNCAAAIDMMRASASALPQGSDDWAEAYGLIGRAYKQIFCDANDKTGPEARLALEQALSAYRVPWDHSENPWHGVNLVALIHRATRLKMPVPSDLSAGVIAQTVVKKLGKIDPEQQDEWHAATLAEAYLGLRDLSAVEREIRKYAAGPKAKAFTVAATLRQFTDVWNIDEGSKQERSIVAALRARLLDLEGHALRVDPREAKAIQEFDASPKTLEAVLGEFGADTYKSMKLGMERALSVASVWLVRADMKIRVGSSFLVRAGDFGSFGRKDIAPGEAIVVTNWHVVNELGVPPGIRPEQAEVRFEAATPPSSHRVSEIIWTTGVDLHDAAFLRLAGKAPKVKPLPLAKRLPTLHDKARVFIIGYPGGRDLALSLQDNKLVGYEGPPNGKPRTPGVRLVHYRTPTEKGSSGSPVFDAEGSWEVVALHHAVSATADANEGIAIDCIQEAIKKKPAGRKKSKR